MCPNPGRARPVRWEEALDPAELRRLVLDAAGLVHALYPRLDRLAETSPTAV